MFNNEDFIKFVSDLYIKSYEYKDLQQRADFKEALKHEIKSFDYKNNLPGKLNDLEHKIIYESIKFSINFINQIIKN